MSNLLVEFLKDCLANSGGDPVTFTVLSDEEIAAIDQTVDPEFSICPWLDAQDDLEPAAFARFGERSLVLRGMLEPQTDETTSELTFAISDELQLVADARRDGIGFLRFTARYDGVRTGRLVVLQQEVGAFEEDVAVEGFHYFTACGFADASRRLAEWSLPIPDEGDLRGEARIAAAEWGAWAVNELGADARHVEADLHLPGRTGQMRSMHWIIAHNDDSAVLAQPDGSGSEQLQVTTTTPSMLTRVLSTEIHNAIATSPGRDPLRH